MTDVKELVATLDSKEGGVMLEGVYKDISGKQYYAFGLGSQMLFVLFRKTKTLKRICYSNRNASIGFNFAAFRAGK